MLPTVRREVRHWRRQAAAIPDPALRDAAVDTLRAERFNADGAALFSTLVPGRQPSLVRLLVAYQTLWDYLDTITEWPIPNQVQSGLQLHRAVVDALDPGARLSDYYVHIETRGDGGYVRALVETCRACCVSLPSYPAVREMVIRDARRANVQALNHHGDSGRRAAALERWARDHFPDETEALWFELTGAAAASLHIHVLLALAADPQTGQREIAETWSVYFPWVSAASTMLDSLVDRHEDLIHGAHSYIAYYDTPQRTCERLTLIAERCSLGARHLPRGERHGVIVAGMAAMYLSETTAGTSTLRDPANAVIQTVGDPAKLLLRIMRLWRALGRKGAGHNRPRPVGDQRARLSAVVSTNQFKNGMHVDVDGTVFKIVEFQHVKPGKGGAFVRTKLKRARDGAVIDRTFRAGEKFRPVHTEARTMQFLYTDGSDAHFMDAETYDQIAIPEDQARDSLRWVLPNQKVDLLYVDESPTDLQVPSAVEMTVTETDPGLRGDTASGGGDKPATLESGVVVRVPLFVNVGDRVRVDTRTGDYLSRS